MKISKNKFEKKIEVNYSNYFSEFVTATLKIIENIVQNIILKFQQFQ